MRALVQRVSGARVEVDGEIVGGIARGLLVFFAASRKDSAPDMDYLVRKIVNLRIFNDENGKMNLNLGQVSGQVLVVSQFTLYAETRKGNRPSFTQAAPPHEGRDWYERFIAAIGSMGYHVETGVFGADMRVHLVNDGPVTIWLDSNDRTLSRRR